MLEEQKQIFADNLQEKKILHEKQHHLTSSADFPLYDQSSEMKGELLSHNHSNFDVDRRKKDNDLFKIKRTDYRKVVMAEQYHRDNNRDLNYLLDDKKNPTNERQFSISKDKKKVIVEGEQDQQKINWKSEKRLQSNLTLLSSDRCIDNNRYITEGGKSNRIVFPENPENSISSLRSEKKVTDRKDNQEIQESIDIQQAFIQTKWKRDLSGANEQRRQYITSRLNVKGSVDSRGEKNWQFAQESSVQTDCRSSEQEKQMPEQSMTSISMQPSEGVSGEMLTGLSSTGKEAKKDARKEAQREVQKEAQKEAVSSAVEEQAENGGNILGHAFSAVKSSAKIAVTTTSRILTAPSAVSQKLSRAEQMKERIINMEVDKIAYDTALKTTTKMVSKTIRSIGRFLWKVIKEFLKKEFVVLLLFFPFVVQVTVILLVVFAVQESGDTYRLEETTAIESNTTTVSNRSEAEIVNGYVFFNQGDYSNAMGVGKDGRVRTIAGSGCGLTAIASVLCKWTDRTDITPETVLNYALNGASGSRCSIVLVSSSMISGLCSQYGLTYKTIVPKNREELRDTLNAGESVIVLLSNRARWCNGNYVTSNTHYIVLMGYSENGTILCMNPAGGTLCYITEDTVVNDTGTDTFHVIYKE